MAQGQGPEAQPTQTVKSNLALSQAWKPSQRPPRAGTPPSAPSHCHPALPWLSVQVLGGSKEQGLRSPTPILHRGQNPAQVTGIRGSEDVRAAESHPERAMQAGPTLLPIPLLTLQRWAAPFSGPQKWALQH